MFRAGLADPVVLQDERREAGEGTEFLAQGVNKLGQLKNRVTASQLFLVG